MTTVQELGALHRRYADTSHRFRAAWTFHQFLQSLSRTGQHRIADAHSIEFQNLYAELKEISQSLNNTTESERIGGRLETIDQRLVHLIDDLDEEDSRVAPYYLRQFFRRVKTVMLTAFSTSSSNATLPTALRVSEENLGVPRQINSFVLTVGATANQNGTALYEGVTVLFLAQLAGVDLTLGQQPGVAAPEREDRTAPK